MRDKIIEIQHKYGEYDRWLETWKYTVEAEKKIVDEILALIKAEYNKYLVDYKESWDFFDWMERQPCYCQKCVGENNMSFEEECPKCGEPDCQQHGYVERASEPTNKTMKAYGCECRHCEPELWSQDEREVWYQRTGDEVI